jgi:hypothetical protein
VGAGIASGVPFGKLAGSVHGLEMRSPLVPSMANEFWGYWVFWEAILERDAR